MEKGFKVIGIIPARYNSTRFPGKVLAKLKGKPIIQHVYERAKQAKRLGEVVVATDNMKISQIAGKFGAKYFITTTKPNSGTERIIEILPHIEANVVINIQGDEPLINPKDIDRLSAIMTNCPDIVMATIITDITPQELWNRNVVKVLVKDGYAIDFSRYNIWKEEGYKHIGIYAYRKDFLLNYYNMPKEPHEMVEKLEQLRAIENGYKIKIIKTKHNSISIDTPEDLEKLRNDYKKY